MHTIQRPSVCINSKKIVNQQNCCIISLREIDSVGNSSGTVTEKDQNQF